MRYQVVELFGIGRPTQLEVVVSLLPSQLQVELAISKTCQSKVENEGRKTAQVVSKSRFG